MNATKACAFALSPWLDGMGATPVAAVAAIGDTWRGTEQSNIVTYPNRNGRLGNMRRTLPCSYEMRVGQLTQGASMSRHAFKTVYWNTSSRSPLAKNGISYGSPIAN